MGDIWRLTENEYLPDLYKSFPSKKLRFDSQSSVELNESSFAQLVLVDVSS